MIIDWHLHEKAQMTNSHHSDNTWRQMDDDKSLPEPVMSKFADPYFPHRAYQECAVIKMTQ